MDKGLDPRQQPGAIEASGLDKRFYGLLDRISLVAPRHQP